MPQPKNVYIDPLLTNVSVKYSNAEFIADLVSPRMPVDKKTGKYFVYDKSNLRPANSLRTGLDRAARIDYDMTLTAYGPLDEHSLEHGITKDELDMYESPLEPRSDATETLTEVLALEHEIEIATFLSSTANLTQNKTFSGTGKWSDYANSTPFDDVELGRQTIMQNAIIKPNTLVISQGVWSKIKNHPDFLARLPITNLKTLTVQLLADLLELDQVIVGSAVYNTATEGQTASMSYVWGSDAILCYVAPAPGIKKVSGLYTLTLKNGRYIDRWTEIGNKGEFVRINDYYQNKLIAVEAMYLMKNVI